jgi:transcription regulator MmyB-like protein
VAAGAQADHRGRAGAVGPRGQVRDRRFGVGLDLLSPQPVDQVEAAPQRNVLWWTFLDPAARTVLADWEEVAKAELARFRSASARHPDDPQFGELIARLQAGSPEVRRWWPEHEVVPLASGVKRIRHPLLGIIGFRHVVLQVADDPEQKLVTFTAGPEDSARVADLMDLTRPDYES